METDPRGWSAAERCGAILLLALAVGLGFIAADIMFGTSKFFRRDCCEEETVPGDTSS